MKTKRNKSKSFGRCPLNANGVGDGSDVGVGYRVLVGKGVAVTVGKTDDSSVAVKATVTIWMGGVASGFCGLGTLHANAPCSITRNTAIIKIERTNRNTASTSHSRAWYRTCVERLKLQSYSIKNGFTAARNPAGLSVETE